MRRRPASAPAWQRIASTVTSGPYRSLTPRSTRRVHRRAHHQGDHARPPGGLRSAQHQVTQGQAAGRPLDAGEAVQQQCGRERCDRAPPLTLVTSWSSSSAVRPSEPSTDTPSSNSSSLGPVAAVGRQHEAEVRAAGVDELAHHERSQPGRRPPVDVAAVVTREYSRSVWNATSLWTGRWWSVPRGRAASRRRRTAAGSCAGGRSSSSASPEATSRRAMPSGSPFTLRAGPMRDDRPAGSSGPRTAPPSARRTAMAPVSKTATLARPAPRSARRGSVGPAGCGPRRGRWRRRRRRRVAATTSTSMSNAEPADRHRKATTTTTRHAPATTSSSSHPSRANHQLHHQPTASSPDRDGCQSMPSAVQRRTRAAGATPRRRVTARRRRVRCRPGAAWSGRASLGGRCDLRDHLAQRSARR